MINKKKHIYNYVTNLSLMPDDFSQYHHYFVLVEICLMSAKTHHVFIYSVFHNIKILFDIIYTRKTLFFRRWDIGNYISAVKLNIFPKYILHVLI